MARCRHHHLIQAHLNFPAWSNTEQSTTDPTGLQGFVNSDILQTYLNIKPEPSTVVEDNVVNEVIDSANNSLPLTGANTPTADMPEIVAGEPLTGGNIVITSEIQEVITKSGNREHITHSDNLELQTSLTPEGNVSIPVMDNANDIMNPQNHDDVVSPIKLKKSCIQTLLQSVPHTDPMSLFEACLDVISWNSEQYFPCNLLLP